MSAFRFLCDKFHRFFEKFIIFRNFSWINENTEKKQDISFINHLFEFLDKIKTNEKASKIWDFNQISSDLKIMRQIIKTQNSQKFTNACEFFVIINILVKIITNKSDQFDQTEKQIELLLNFKNIHRAYVILRTWFRENEKSKQFKRKSFSKIQNKSVKSVTYFQVNTINSQLLKKQELLKKIENKFLLNFDSLSELESDSKIDKFVNLALIEKKEKQKIIDLDIAIKHLLSLTMMKMKFLSKYALKQSHISQNSWVNEKNNKSNESQFNKVLRNIIKKIQDIVRKVQAQTYAHDSTDNKKFDENVIREQHVNDNFLSSTFDNDLVFSISNDSDQDNDFLDHVFMTIMRLKKSYHYLDMNEINCRFISVIKTSLKLLRHQITRIVIIMREEWHAFENWQTKALTLQASILRNDMRLEKTIQMLALVFYIHKHEI